MGPNLIALAIPFFFLFIGLELWVARRRGVAVYRLGDALSNLGCGIGNQVVNLLFATAAMTSAYEWTYQHRLLDLPPGAATWVAAFLGVEFAYYWWHRLSHEVNVLWAAHVVHHHSEDYNLAVALRQSVTTWATTLLFYLPLALLGVPTLPFAVTLGVSTLYQFWIHTELIPAWPRAEWLFNTPALHRVHHAINPRYLDRNHGAILSVWDRLFGTFEPEGEPCVYGTTRPLRSCNPLWAQVETWADLVRLARRAPTALDALKVFVASPAWRPAWMGGYEARDPATKYDPQVSPGVQRYALWQWGALLVGVTAFLFLGPRLSPGSLAAATALIALSLASLPALVEGRPWARSAEAARLALVPVVAVLLVVLR
jgi:sterol desaturase/sphingolipid hydroxylase (fatty acid hydroxylase superfamily)